MLKLHNYFRSSTSTRLRIALNLKGLSYDYLSYALLQSEHQSDAYLAKNPAGLVPALELSDGQILTQSLAIIEYLDEVHPNPPLLPADPLARAQVRSLAYMIACEVHPVNNLRLLTYIGTEFEQDQAGKAKWFRHWVQTTFDPLEQILAARAGRYASGDTPGLADLCLYAQVWNNQRFAVDMSAYPVIQRIFDDLHRLEAFAQAAPPNQPDAPAV